MQRIFFISFPRSGHHYTVDLLDSIYDINDQYCEYYHCYDTKDRKIPCIATRWPKRFKLPCRAGRRMQKNHDFRLKAPYSPKHLYVVQYRYPLESICSHYDFHRKNQSPRSTTGFRDFVMQDLEFWRKFMIKWAVEKRGADNLLLVDYHDIATDRAAALRLFDFLQFSKPNGEQLQKLDLHYAEQQNRPLRDLKENPYFDAELFAEFEDAIEPAIWDATGMRKRFSTERASNAASLQSMLSPS